MKRIGLISLTQIFPPSSGGQIRSSSLATALSELGYEVDVFCLTGRKAEYKQLRGSSLEEIGPRLRQYVSRAIVPGFWQWLCYRLEWPDLWLGIGSARWALPAFMRAALDRCDLLIFDFPYSVHLTPFFVGKPKLLLSHNVESERWHERPRLRRWVAALEAKAARSVDLVLACAPSDQQMYRKLGARDCLLVANGIDPKRLLAAPEAIEAARRQSLVQADARERILLFSASRYGPNLEALAFLRSFVQQHREELRRLRITFLVVGSVADSPGREDGLLTTGPLESLAPFFHLAEGAINPVFSGSGTNVKMFEYMAMKLPILSSSFGSRGLRFEDGVDGLVFESDSLMETLRRYVGLSALERRSLAESAFHRNRERLEMEEILRRTLLPLLEKGAAAPA